MARRVLPTTLGGVQFLAVMDEALTKENKLVDHDVEDGLPVTQLGRVRARSGNLNLTLADTFLNTATKEAQKRALDRLFDIKAQGAPISLSTPLESVARVLIEKIEYQRAPDKKRSVIGAVVSWREVRVSKTQVVNLELVGRIDPVTQEYVDSIAQDRGFVSPVPQPCTADVSMGTTQSAQAWNQTWGTP